MQSYILKVYFLKAKPLPHDISMFSVTHVKQNDITMYCILKKRYVVEGSRLHVGDVSLYLEYEERCTLEVYIIMCNVYTI